MVAAPHADSEGTWEINCKAMRSFSAVCRRMATRWCGWRDLNPHEPRAQRIFLPTTAFAALASLRICGLDYPFTLSRPRDVGAARLVSTPSMPAHGLARDCHVRGFPEFEQFYISSFPEMHSSQFKSVASADSATPAVPLGRSA